MNSGASGFLPIGFIFLDDLNGISDISKGQLLANCTRQREKPRSA